MAGSPVHLRFITRTELLPSRHLLNSLDRPRGRSPWQTQWKMGKEYHRLFTRWHSWLFMQCEWERERFLSTSVKFPTLFFLPVTLGLHYVSCECLPIWEMHEIPRSMMMCLWDVFPDEGKGGRKDFLRCFPVSLSDRDSRLSSRCYCLESFSLTSSQKVPQSSSAWLHSLFSIGRHGL